METQSHCTKQVRRPVVCSLPTAGRIIYGWQASQSYAHPEAFGDALVCVGRRKFLICSKLAERFGVDESAFVGDDA